MPFFSQGDEVLPRAPEGVPPQAPPPGPSGSDVLAAAARQSNTIVSTYNYLHDFPDQQVDPNHNPLSIIGGTPYERDHLQDFVGSRNEADTRAIMRRIDQEDADNRTLAASGVPGMVASVGMGLLDPTLFLPGGVIMDTAKGGATILRSAAALAAAGATQSAVQEGVLYGTQETRTPGQVAANVGVATVLSGILGAGAGALLGRAERAGLEQSLTADRAAWVADLKLPGEMSVGAAEADTRQLQLRSFGPRIIPGVGTALDAAGRAIDQVPGARRVLDIGLAPARLAKKGVEGIVTGPLLRVFSTDSLAGKRAMADLAETPLQFEENRVGIPTTQGPTVSRAAKMAIDGSRVRLADQMDSLYRQYRFGTSETTALQRARTAILGYGGPSEGKLSYSDFKGQVDLALRSGDTHEIPEVQQASEYVRREILDPWKERAIKAGLLPEDVSPETAESYMTRVYNKTKIAAERNTFVGTTTDWLASEQETKRGIQERLSGLHDDLQVARGKIDSIGRHIERGDESVAEAEIRREEVRRLNKFAFQRSEKLSHPPEARAGRLENARGGAVFETKIRNRGNTLAEQAAGRSDAVDSLHDSLSFWTERHDRLRKDIEDHLAAWEGKSSTEAKAAMKARAEAEKLRQQKIDAGIYEGKNERLTAADAAVDQAVSKILESNRELPREELTARANEITDRILSGPDGRLPYDAPNEVRSSGGPNGPLARGPLAARNFMIPDALIRDFLEQDVEHTARSYLDTFVPDVLLTERFGDTEMTQAFKRINDEAAAKSAAAPDATARRAIEKERQAVIEDLAAVRDRVRGLYGWSSGAGMRNAGRIAASIKRYDFMTNLGGVALSSVNDFAGTIFRYGFTSTLRHGWIPFLKGLRSIEGAPSAYRQARRQFRSLGIAAETAIATRQHAWNEVADMYRPTSRFERGLATTSDKFGVATGITVETDISKTIAGMVASSEIMRAAEMVSKGSATRKQITRLAEAGIDQPTAERIWSEYSTSGGGNKVDGVHLANTGLWTSARARDAFEAAIARDVDIAVVTPGQEKPLWLSRPVAGIIGQYKSFVAASTERMLLANLQQHDFATLQGLVSTVALGMVIAAAYSKVAGTPAPQRPQDWIKEGINRSGVLGWIDEGNAISAKLTRGSLDVYRLIGADKPLQRYASRSVLASLLGPTAGKVEALAQISGAASESVAAKMGGRAPNGGWSAADTRRLRRLIATQNMLYLRKLFDQVEHGVNGFLGVPEKAPPSDQ